MRYIEITVDGRVLVRKDGKWIEVESITFEEYLKSRSWNRFNAEHLARLVRPLTYSDLVHVMKRLICEELETDGPFLHNYVKFHSENRIYFISKSGKISECTMHISSTKCKMIVVKGIAYEVLNVFKTTKVKK